ncbi:hypothetical protein AB4298_07495 [Shewanella sp. 10N.261.52.F9]|uniref:hypothetical protein n=1 Tax=Shewanella sp. 10N.261.52.F9 TaxID=3229684 RepID=UPI0035527E09
MSTDLKKELMELIHSDAVVDSPEGVSWIAKAANTLWKDKLEAGQVWEYTAENGFKKVWVN